MIIVWKALQETLHITISFHKVNYGKFHCRKTISLLGGSKMNLLDPLKFVVDIRHFILQLTSLTLSLELIDFIEQYICFKSEALYILMEDLV